MSAPTSSANMALIFFHYQPINIAPQIFIALFAIIAAAFIHRIIKTKSGRWLYILPGTAIAEMLGYIFRTLCINNTTMGNYVGMTLFLLVSPNALALVNYKTLGNVIAAKKHQSNDTKKDPFWLRPKFVTWFFFSSDIFAFILQGGGGGMQATDSLRSLGSVITLVGLCIQLFFFACFTAIAIYVDQSNVFEYQLVSSPHRQPKRQVMICLFVTIVLLYIRSIYRVAEYATGYDGPIATAEWAFYVFDSAIIVGSFIAYYIWFVGDRLPSRGNMLDDTPSFENVHLASLNK